MVSPPPISPFPHPTPSSLRGVREGSLERALLAVLLLGLLLGVVHVVAAYALAPEAWPALLFAIVYAVWLGAALLAWWRRPGNETGQLMLLGAAAIFLGGIANVPVPAFIVINSVCATLILAVVVHILHAFPSGRLRNRASLATVVLGYVVCIGFDLAATIAASHAPGVVGTLRTLQTGLGIFVMIVTAVLLARRLVLAEPAHRRLLLPLYVYGIVSVLIVPIIPMLVRPEWVSALFQLAVLAGLPIAFLLGVMLGGFRRTTAIEALSAWLAIAGSARSAVAEALATTLGDDTVQVVYWVPERAAYVDERGEQVSREAASGARGWIDVRVEGRLVGAIGYDTRITADPSSVRRAGEVLAIAIDRERLTNELLASNDELAQSRLRLVQATYRERSRIARDLHDGLQVQLVLLALEAQQIANSPHASPATKAEAEHLRHGVDAAAADLRDLVHNVLPATLFEQGLTAAAEDLVDRLVVPATLQADVDESKLAGETTLTAYLVLAEALSNAVKHSRASAVGVDLRAVGDRLHLQISDNGVGTARVDGGSGLRGLADRVAAIDGSMAIDSHVGKGTVVRVDLPCAS